ncbi:hypothetical protein MMC12_008412 [Toensbergia leucococca]|nr:hypothetical protein [Toensbergia leucococca]
MKVSLLLHPLLFSTAAGWVLECNSRITLPPGPADMTFTAAESVYNSLSALCGQYEAGLGYECSDAGHLTAFPPGTLISPEVLGGISPLFRAQQATNYLAHACESHCWCSDVQEFEEGLPLQCSQNDQSVPVAYPYPDVQCNAPQYRDSSKPSGVVCTGAVYGSPIVDDCNLANARVGLIDGNARKVYQFLDDRGTSTNPTGDQIVQTPRAFSSGKPHTA